MIMFPLNDESESLHQMLAQCGNVTKMVGTGYKLELDRNEFAITRPNDVTSLLTQTTVCDVLILYGRYDMVKVSRSSSLDLQLKLRNSVILNLDIRNFRRCPLATSNDRCLFWIPDYFIWRHGS